MQAWSMSLLQNTTTAEEQCKQIIAKRNHLCEKEYSLKSNQHCKIKVVNFPAPTAGNNLIIPNQGEFD